MNPVDIELSENVADHEIGQFSDTMDTLQSEMTADDRTATLGALLAKVYGMVPLDELEIRIIFDEVLLLLKEEATLLDLDPPINVCGDTHGQFHDAIRIFNKAGWPPKVRYLFLGDYVDRGQNGVELISMLFLFKCLFPNDFYLLRGNHECYSINSVYGFYEEFKSRYSFEAYLHVHQVFVQLPIAALISGRIFCVHGGLSPDLNNMDYLRSIKRPIAVNDNDLIRDLLWSDPDVNLIGWDQNHRGCSFTFGADVVHDFCRKMDIDVIIRAHQVVDNGFAFFANKKMITVFSAPNYCGVFSNAAGVVLIDDMLKCRIITFRSNTRYFPREIEVREGEHGQDGDN